MLFQNSCGIKASAYNVALPSERKKSSWICWTIEISPPTRWILLGHIELLCIRALTWACAFAAATCYARPRASRRKSLNILTAGEPMGLSSRCQLLLLASHRMALTRECKIPIRIAREIEIFSIFASLVPTLVPKHNLRFRVFRSTIYWSWWLINIYETFGGKKITVSLWNVVSAPCYETGPNLRMLLVVDRWL